MWLPCSPVPGSRCCQQAGGSLLRGLLGPVQRGNPTGQFAFKGVRVRTIWKKMTSNTKQYLQQVLALGS